jgi:phage terminase small subunit
MKLLQGNPGKRPLPKNEPKPKVGCDPPPWLPVDARAQWKRLAPRLIELGILTEVDGDAFAALCMLTANLAVLGTIQGAAIADCTRELRQLWGRFGMTPADRSKVAAAPPKAADPFEEFLGKAKA